MERRLGGRAGLKPPYVLGGWSLGGYLIRLYTKSYPDEVLGLVTVDGTPVGLPPGVWPNGKPTAEPYGGGPEPVLIQADDAELAADPSVGSRPLIVLVRGEPDGATADEFSLWQTLQYEVARLSTSRLFVRADESGHHIHEQAPRLTVEALRQVVAAARAGTGLPACASTPLPVSVGPVLTLPAETESFRVWGSAR